MTGNDHAPGGDRGRGDGTNGDGFHAFTLPPAAPTVKALVRECARHVSARAEALGRLCRALGPADEAQLRLSRALHRRREAWLAHHIAAEPVRAAVRWRMRGRGAA